MYFKKEYKGTGIAKGLVDFILEKVRNLEGLEIINLMVVSENLRAKTFDESFFIMSVPIIGPCANIWKKIGFVLNLNGYKSSK